MWQNSCDKGSFESAKIHLIFGILEDFRFFVFTYEIVGFLTGFASVELAFLFHSVSFVFDPNKHEYNKHPFLKYLQL